MAALSSLRHVAHSGVKLGLDQTSFLLKNSYDVMSNLRKARLLKIKVARILARQNKTGEVFRYGKQPLPSYADTSWPQAYFNANGLPSDFYVPEDLFAISIEPKLNPAERCGLYNDKNNYDKIRFPCSFPRTLGRIVAGNFLTADYVSANPENVLEKFPTVVVKPSMGTWGGNNVSFMSGEEAARFARAKSGALAAEEYIIQEPIVQSEQIAALAPDSVNTLRIMTIYEKGTANVLSSVLRLGRNGSRTDNITGGGLSCGIKDGRLIANGYDEFLCPLRAHPDTKVRFEGYEIPGFDEAEELCRKLHRYIPELGLISWDVALDQKNSPMIVELNLTQGINLHQAAHGPLFGDRLPALLERTQPKVFLNYPVG